jgi:hypothetical protein
MSDYIHWTYHNILLLGMRFKRNDGEVIVSDIGTAFNLGLYNRTDIRAWFIDDYASFLEEYVI